MEVWTVLVLSQ